MSDSNNIHNAPAPNRKAHQRRRYVINAAFQWRYAAAVTLVVCLTSATISSILYTVLHHQARMRTIHAETYTASVIWVVFLSSIAFALVPGICVGLWSILVTHRICGPLFVMKRALEELAAGRFPELRQLRRKDEFKDLYETVSTPIDAVKESKRREQAILAETVDIVKSITHNPDSPSDLEHLTRQLDALGTELAEVLGEHCERTSEPSPVGTVER